MQHYEDDDTRFRPAPRRETTPARLMGLPAPVRQPRPPHDSFGWHAPPQHRPGPGAQGFPQPPQPEAYYAPYYYPGAPQGVPMYYPPYQPQPVQYFMGPPPPAMPEPSLMGFSSAPRPSAPLSRVDSRIERSRTFSRSSSRSGDSDVTRRAFVARPRARSHSSSRSRSGSRTRDRPVEAPLRIRRDIERSNSPPRSQVRDFSGYEPASDDEADLRERPRHEYRRRTLDEEGFEDAGSTTVYSFTPSRVSRSPSAETGAQGDDGELGRDVQVTEAVGAAQKEASPGLRLAHVYKSQYNGEHILGGSHGARLEAVMSNQVKSQGLFRWLHCTQSVMNFEDFSTKATRVPGLTTVEQKGIRDLLARVQRKFARIVQTADGRSVRHMDPACIQHVLPTDGGSATARFARRTVTWVCLPYFTLEKYSGLQGAGEDSGAFPIETLLQAKFSRAGKERDMRQAVCLGKDTPAGMCFHVAQLWCLVVDNSFLFTYSRIKQESLGGDSVELAIKSIQSSSNPQPTIAVSYKQSVMWSISVEEGSTWLDFLSHFRDFWPRRLQFFHRKRPVTASDWPRICNMARHVSERIVLDMRIGPRPEPPPVGMLVPRPVRTGVRDDLQTTPQSQPTLSKEKKDGKSASDHVAPGKLSPDWKSRNDRKPGEAPAPPALAIFACLVGVSHPDFETIDEEALDDHMQEVDDYLLSGTSFSDRRAYNTCPEATRDGIYDFLEKQGVELSKLQGGRQAKYETKIDIFNAADKVFGAFFPPDVNVPTIKKFWGAVQAIISDGEIIDSREDRPLRRARPTLSPSTLRDTRHELRELCVRLELFSEHFAHCDGREQAKIAVPKEFVQGWIHLLMALVYLGRDYYKSDQLLKQAKDLIDRGMESVVRSMSEAQLLDSSIVLPKEILSLLSLELLRDVTVGAADISQCYSGSLDSMEAEIASKPSDRSREYRLNLLSEEISVVQRILDAQSSVSRTLLDFAFNDSPASLGALPPPADPPFQYRSRSTDRRQEHTEPAWYMRNAEARSVPYNYEGWPTYQPAANDHSRSRSHSYGREEVTHVAYDETPIYAAEAPPTDFKLSPTDPGGYRVLLLRECLQFLGGRQRDFYGFRDWATFLEKANRNKIDTTKDRHDNAIYAFTIVTIIFLPISAVASIFGMNTRDVRDMDLDQWAYWAAALPVTAAVVFLGLLWTGELGNMLRWVQSFGSRRQGYQALSVPPDGDGYYAPYPPPPPPPPAPPPLVEVMRREDYGRY